MTQEEKYVMSRTAACLAVSALDDYPSSLMIDWVCYNEQYKRLNEDLHKLIEKSKNGENTEDDRQKIYEEQLDVSAKMKNIQLTLDIPDEFLEKKSKTEDYMLTQMHIKLALLAPDEKEPELLLAWSAANLNLKNTNKKLKVLYAKGKKNGFRAVSEEYAEAKRLKEECTAKKDEAVSKLEELAKEQKRSLENFPLRKSR